MRKANYYRLTAAGRRRLKEETAYWRRFSEAIGFALEALPEDV
jgi:DNA-binding PadR family transcriptional regulator